MNVTATYTNSQGVSEGAVTIIEMTIVGRDAHIAYIDGSGNLKRDMRTIPATATGLPIQLAHTASHN